MMAMTEPPSPEPPPPETKQASSLECRPVVEMEHHLRFAYQRPIALRLKSETAIKCPFFLNLHNHGDTVGYVKPPEECIAASPGLIINDRTFSPSYGYTIMEYEHVNGVYMLSQPPNLPRVDLIAPIIVTTV